MNRREWIRFFKFGMVGVLNTLIDFFVFNLLLIWNCSPVFAKGISYTAGTVNSFFCNKNWTFQSRRKNRFVPFLLWNFLLLLFNMGCMNWLSFPWNGPVFDQFPFLKNNLNNLVVVCITTVINFIGSRFLIFRNK